MAKDYSDIPGERLVFVKAWQIIEKYRHVPMDKDHRDIWDGVATDCMELSMCADQYGAAVVILAQQEAKAIFDYYEAKLKDVNWN